MTRPDLLDTALTVLGAFAGAALAFLLVGAAACVVAGWVP